MKEFAVEKKRIGQNTYWVTQLDAVRGSKALLRLLKYVGPVVEAMFAKDTGGDLAAGKKLTELLTEEDLQYFLDLMAAQTVVTGPEFGEGEPALDNMFGHHFAGNYLDMFAWLHFALGVNFGSFFAGAVAKVAKVMAKATAASLESATLSTSPNTSTGSSGEF